MKKMLCALAALAAVGVVVLAAVSLVAMDCGLPAGDASGWSGRPSIEGGNPFSGNDHRRPFPAEPDRLRHRA